MDSEFYNAFATSTTPAAIAQAMNLENETGTTQKPPRLMSIEEYYGWKDRFENWVQANHLRSWECILKKYSLPRTDLQVLKEISEFTDQERAMYRAEKMMISLLQQAIKEDIFILLQHDKTAKSIWDALKVKFEGSENMIKSKKALSKKEFDLFSSLPREDTKKLIERYCHLVRSLSMLGVEKGREEWVDKLADALPQKEWGTYLMILKNTGIYDGLTISQFIEKIESQDLEQQKIARMNSPSGQQDVKMYYRGSVPVTESERSPKIQTAFSAGDSSEKADQGSNKSSSGFSSFPSVNPKETNTSFQSQSTKTGNGYVIQCNIALNLPEGQSFSEDTSKDHMALLGSVLLSYEGLVAGRIGNPMLTKEDYDQIDAEEMELMDIKWCLASVLRRAEKFKTITGRNDFLDAHVSTLGFDKSKVTCFRCREKGHFKRECKGREASGAQNPFGKDDYYRKAIYQQVGQSQELQTAHGRKIEDPKRACLVDFSWSNYISSEATAAHIIDQDDEKLPEGFSWDMFVDEKGGFKAFIAKIVREPDLFATWMKSIGENVKSEDEKSVSSDESSDSTVELSENSGEVSEGSDEDLQSSDNSVQNENVQEKEVAFDKTPPDSDVSDGDSDKSVKFDQSPDHSSSDDEEEKHINIAKTHLSPESFHFYFAERMEKLKEKRAAKEQQAESEGDIQNSENVAEKITKAVIEEEKVVEFVKTIEVEKIVEVIKPCEKCLEACKNCAAKDDIVADTGLQKTNSEREQALTMLNAVLLTKQKAINFYIEESAKWKQELETEKIENERIRRLLQSYSSSDYLIDRIYPTVGGMEAFKDEKLKEKKDCGKKSTVSYNKFPPPIWDGYSPRRPNEEQLEKAVNIKLKIDTTDVLPDNIDVTYTSSDTDHESVLIKKVVDQVLDTDEESESKYGSGKSKSSVNSQNSSDKRSYSKEFLLSKADLNDETFEVVYTLNGSDKLYYNKEFPIMSIKTELINKTFKLIEVNIPELKVLKSFEKSKKYISRVQQRLNKKKGNNSGSVFQKKPNQNRSYKKKGLGFVPPENDKNMKNSKTKSEFVSGGSAEEEQQKPFWRQSNKEFLAERKKNGADICYLRETRTCYRCNEAGHIAWNCSNSDKLKQGVSQKLKEKVVDVDTPNNRLKIFENSKFEVGECSEKNFYKKKGKDNQVWVAKNGEVNVGDESGSTKPEEPQIEKKISVNDEEFPSLKFEELKKKVGKTEISNQFYKEKDEFDVEKTFNGNVKKIFGKMLSGRA
ncbi:putative transcription factor interactor and regulator CCHC(Zn) family [Helianthus annuus]|nr:putative transcription factor interactor and regulator CCHC(Zn) family [Helianthus annuus]KAJ0584180.1 putative transcription factor interactor and regulator CCHC(Zn) family [Helianthus annuus]KAJ0749849.1 putative transcription factor interactor and regulator CCHC(Zn) family [Helianthus annuus]